MTVCRIPFTLDPHPGESFDSWIEAYAARLHVSIRDLGAALGLPGSALGVPIRVLLTRTITDTHRRRIASATGLDTATLDDMFHRPGPGPQAIPASAAPAIRNAWTPTRGTRFCPSCLAGNGGRFQLAWRLPWAFFCLHHDRLLTSACPQCHRPPRIRVVAADLQQPSRCRNRLPQQDTSRPAPSCGADLASATHPALTEPVRACAVQRFINDQLRRIDDHNADSPEHLTATEALIDLSVIASHLGTPAVTADQQQVHTDTLHANTLIDAVDLLTAVDTDPDPVIAVVQRRAPAARPRAIPESWRLASPNLRARITHRRDASLSTTERIRHATTLPTPTAPSRSSSVDPALARANRLPDQLWPAWALRLIDDDRIDPVAFRRAVVVALLVPHSNRTLNQATPLIGPHISGEAVESHMTTLAKTPNGRTALRIVTELALALDQQPVPIDYRRRRRLATTTELLDAVTWKQLTRRCYHFPGANRRLDFARSYLYEILTGGSLSIAPTPYTLRAPARDRYYEFVLGLSAALVDALTEHASTLLANAGITDEPLQWQPPTHWVSTSDWPGTDPDQTDPAPLQEALQQEQPVGLIARNHGMSIEHLRHVIRQHPLPGRTSPLPRAGTLVPLNATGKRIPKARYVDVDWLREQYQHQQRGLSDLAAEIGCGISRLAGFAKEHGIVLRPQGGSGPDYIDSHVPPAVRTDLPDLLRAALGGHHARQRVDRFLLLTQTNNMSRVAEQIGISSANLTEQLALLESRCGGLLFNRRPRRIGQLTPLGEQLQQQAQFHLPPPIREAVQA